MTTKKTSIIVGSVKKIGNKTASVFVENKVIGKLYKKVMKRSKLYSVHVDNIEIKIGDEVEIEKCRPMSKTKHWRLKSVRSVTKK